MRKSAVIVFFAVLLVFLAVNAFATDIGSRNSLCGYTSDHLNKPNGRCEPNKGETSDTCYIDCSYVSPCGDQWCQGWELYSCQYPNNQLDSSTCVKNENKCGDCSSVCGDGRCGELESLGFASSPQTRWDGTIIYACPQDCRPTSTCGNGVCEKTTNYYPGEDQTSCPKDCGCGTGKSFDSISATCKTSSVCGNKVCESDNKTFFPVESPANCLIDCSCNSGEYFDSSTETCKKIPECETGTALNANNVCVPICSKNNPSECKTKEACEAQKIYWCKNQSGIEACSATPCTIACNANNLSSCNSKEKCETVKLFWCTKDNNSYCSVTECSKCSANSLQYCINASDCAQAKGKWCKQGNDFYCAESSADCHDRESPEPEITPKNFNQQIPAMDSNNLDANNNQKNSGQEIPTIDKQQPNKTEKQEKTETNPSQGSSSNDSSGSGVSENPRSGGNTGSEKGFEKITRKNETQIKETELVSSNEKVNEPGSEKKVNPLNELNQSSEPTNFCGNSVCEEKESNYSCAIDCPILVREIKVGKVTKIPSQQEKFEIAKKVSTAKNKFEKVKQKLKTIKEYYKNSGNKEKENNIIIVITILELGQKNLVENESKLVKSEKLSTEELTEIKYNLKFVSEFLKDALEKLG